MTLNPTSQRCSYSHDLLLQIKYNVWCKHLTFQERHNLIWLHAEHLSYINLFTLKYFLPFLIRDILKQFYAKQIQAH